MIFLAAMLSGAVLAKCQVVDGDTIRCSRERIRLVGIDAPELPGHCRHGRRCVPGNPVASAESLRQAMQGRLQIERFGRDHYGRTLALVRGTNGDLSCWQVKERHAVYKPQWDKLGRVKSCLTKMGDR